MKNFIKNLSVILSSVIVTLLFLELILRLTGNEPFKHLNTTSPMPIFKEDNKLGWDTKPGNFLMKINNNEKVNYKILNDGSRYSGYISDNSIKKILLVGGSFTLGQAINDEDTLSYFIQDNLEDYEIKNFGVSGYGTYQSYIKLKKIFETNKNVEYVIYPFIDHHEIRNYGDASWHEFLSKNSKISVSLPYVKLNKKNDIIEYPPLKYMVLPLSNYSVLLSKIQKKIMRISFYSKHRDKELITKKLILKMSKFTKKNGAKFIFVNLYSNKENISKYKKFSIENNIQFLDCQIELDKKYLVKNEGHPNSSANKKYSECILQLIN
tara:strand:- start:9874 stop:10842 length:969 start_codon:yes stop_codon:yes gene_type:complete